jgi:hypothetical protein
VFHLSEQKKNSKKSKKNSDNRAKNLKSLALKNGLLDDPNRETKYYHKSVKNEPLSFKISLWNK